MPRAVPRTGLGSCRLVRSLSRLSVVDVADSNQPLAERLGGWLGVTNAIAVFAALNPGSAPTPATPSGAPSPGGVTLPEELSRVRMALTNSIMGGNARIKPPQAGPGTPMEVRADFSAYRRYILAQQRHMAASIRPLRLGARETLSACSSGLRRLADLDAALDRALAPREDDLLTAVPSLLEKRFENLREAHRAALIESGEEDDPERWMLPDQWLAVFHRELQDVLLAELELRLQPVVGLIEAYGNELA